MTHLRPALSDIRVSGEFLHYATQSVHLCDTGFRALTRLVSAAAAGLVWTYSPPGDGTLPSDDQSLARIAGVSLRKWRSIKAAVMRDFSLEDDKWHLQRDWIAVSDAPVRFGIPAEIRSQVVQREGRSCTYCGDTEGPFDFDHIFPVSRGGTNDPSNLTLACATCNRSKGARALREWIGR